MVPELLLLEGLYVVPELLLIVEEDDLVVEFEEGLTAVDLLWVLEYTLEPLELVRFTVLLLLCVPE